MKRTPNLPRRVIGRLLAAGVLLPLFACQETYSMDALKSSRYFADPAVAQFVDHVQRGDVAGVRQGLSAGISPNALGSDGFRPIFFVFVASKADVLRELLSARADPNARLSNGNTPLHFAVRMTNPDFTAALLAAKADPNARGENQRPVIHTAVAYPTLANTELLLKAGADINAAWADSTPLVAAVAGFKWAAARLLLQLGADTAFKDKRGETAADWWCGQLKSQPVVDKYRGDVLALADAFAARGVTLACAAEVQRFR